MQKPTRPVAKMAVEILYNSIDKLNHHDAGTIRLVYFGHQSEGQKKITRQVSEAIVMQLESNGMHIVNGLSEAALLLTKAGWTVDPPDLPGEAPEAPGEPVEAPETASAASSIFGGTDA